MGYLANWNVPGKIPNFLRKGNIPVTMVLDTTIRNTGLNCVTSGLIYISNLGS